MVLLRQYFSKLDSHPQNRRLTRWYILKQSNYMILSLYETQIMFDNMFPMSFWLIVFCRDKVCSVHYTGSKSWRTIRKLKPYLTLDSFTVYSSTHVNVICRCLYSWDTSRINTVVTVLTVVLIRVFQKVFVKGPIEGPLLIVLP